jgi:hypothetical protein
MIDSEHFFYFLVYIYAQAIDAPLHFFFKVKFYAHSFYLYLLIFNLP